MWPFTKKKKPEETSNLPEASQNPGIEFIGPQIKATRASKEIVQDYVDGGQNPATDEVEKYYSTSELINSCVRFIAETAGMAKPRVYRLNPNTGEKLPVRDKKLRDWINRPNPFLTWQNLIELNIKSLLLSGNGYLTFEKVKGTYETWSLVPSKVDVVPDKTNYLKGYIFDQKIAYKPEEIIHTKIPSIRNFYYGESPVLSLVDSLLLESYSVEELKATYQNGVLIKGVLQSSLPLSPDQIDTLREQFNQLYNAQSKYNRGVAVLPSGLTFEPISMNTKEAGLLDSLGIANQRVLQVFRINPIVLGGLAEATTRIRELYVSVLTNAVLPYIKNVEQQVTLFLRKQYKDDNIVFELDLDEISMLESAFEIKANTIKTLVSTGVLSLNEGRELLNLPKIDSEFADKHVLPAYLVGSEVNFIEDLSETSQLTGNNAGETPQSPPGSSDPQGGAADMPGADPTGDNTSNNSPS